MQYPYGNLCPVPAFPLGVTPPETSGVPPVALAYCLFSIIDVPWVGVVGFGASPCPSGITISLPTSTSPFAGKSLKAMIFSFSALNLLAMASMLSPDFITYLTPETGRINKVSPGIIESTSLMSFAQSMVFIETLFFAAIEPRLSPDCTMYILTPPSSSGSFIGLPPPADAIIPCP
ncbi:MAG: hypothetical protein ACD_9C00194G0003 [uncultured bacterium]|nr:MAG: hypothetical protein ACD_9C00194G0003 [uncultured bacterium]